MNKIKNFKDFVRNKLNENKNQSTFEITDVRGREDESVISDHYPDNLTYKGEEFFNNIYMNLIDFASNVIGIGERYEVEADEDDEDYGEYYLQYERIDGQECYLGYLKDKDVFISGWDMFTDYEVTNNVVFVKYLGNGKFKDVTKKFNAGNKYGGITFYGGRFPSYNKLRADKAFKNLVDIRLD